MENSGDPPDFTNYYQDGDGGGLSYWNCVYFLMVTMSTVGKYILLHVWNLIDKRFKKMVSPIIVGHRQKLSCDGQQQKCMLWRLVFDFPAWG